VTAKIFGIGFPKTGTTSLEVALEMLGYRVCRGHGRNNHSNYLMALAVHRDFEEIAQVIRHFDAFADLPWGGTDLYRWLAQAYPDARFVLTLRDPQRWYQSLLGLALKVNPDMNAVLQANHARGAYGSTMIMRRLWGLDSFTDAREPLIQRFEAYNRDVQEFFREQPERLLAVDLTRQPRWDDLCRFLDKPVPEAEFPHENPAKPNR